MAAVPEFTQQQMDDNLKTFRDFLMQYNTVTEQCFGACVNGFTTRLVVSL